MVDKFLTMPCRMQPISFDIPNNRGWRPQQKPIEISDDESASPENSSIQPATYSITKVTSPGPSGGSAVPESKFGFVCFQLK